MLNNKFIWFVPAGMVALGILLLSTVLAIPIQIEGVSHIDKWEHCFAYLVLVVSFLIAFRKTEILSKKSSLVLVIVTSAYGFALELVQYLFFEFRVFEWVDALANMLGVLIGYGLFKLFVRG
ncbi:VanZ family protein [Ekhidna sp.]|uniref:VanZ family protein n=1 Tax=Ekhidna sp. TaxID=2608089 RepID=UPI0032EFC7E9